MLVSPYMIPDPLPHSMIVAILGAGPAGMSCANACLSFGLTPVVIERSDHVGGAQRTNFHPNLWMLGAPRETGEEMTRRMADHYASLPVTTRFQVELTRLEGESGNFRLTLHDQGGATDVLHVDAIVLATGMRPFATTELEELARETCKVIIGPLSDTIRDGIRGSEVLILGGGDNALDHALYLAERGNRVTVCTRTAFSARAAFMETCRAHAAIELRTGNLPTRLIPTEKGVRSEWPEEDRDFDWLLVMYGYRPNTDLLERFAPHLRPDMTTRGHIQVDTWQRTSTPGIYAAGDITDSPQPSVPTAMAQGLAAARAIERDIVNS